MLAVPIDDAINHTVRKRERERRSVIVSKRKKEMLLAADTNQSKVHLYRGKYKQDGFKTTVYTLLPPCCWLQYE